MQENLISLAGRSFRYLAREADSPRRTLLLLHGLGDSTDQFSPVAELLPQVQCPVLLFSNSRHNFHSENPQAAARATSSFLGVQKA